MIIGGILWFYTNSAIQNYEQMLNSPNLTLEEMYRYEGALQWWRTSYVTVFYPVTVISIAMGLLAVVGPILHVIVRQVRANKSFKEDFQRAFKASTVGEE